MLGFNHATDLCALEIPQLQFLQLQLYPQWPKVPEGEITGVICRVGRGA